MANKRVIKGVSTLFYNEGGWSRKRVLTLFISDQVRACEHKSRVTVSVKDKIAGIVRNEDSVRGELETLGGNVAARVGVNAVVAESEPTDGRRVFLIYHCPRG